MNQYPPSITLAKLYECTSSKGKPYYRGRLGAANVVLLSTSETSDNGQPIWVLKISEPAARTEAREGHSNREAKEANPRGQDREVFKFDESPRPDFEDAIPF